MIQKVENPVNREWDIKKCISDYVRTNNNCKLIDILNHCELWSYEEVTRALLNLQFIGMIAEDENENYRYIADEGNYYGNGSKYNRK